MIVVGEDKSCEPTVFSFPFPENIKELYHKEVIMNSYLYCAGLLLLWLITEELCPELMAAYVALWSENSPTVVWVKRFAARGSKIAMQSRCLLAVASAFMMTLIDASSCAWL